MNNSIPISVIMSVYNEPVEWLEQSVGSILNQTFKDFEFIIICDNPSNNTITNLIARFAEKDGRIKIIINDKNIGLTKSLNKGLSIAKGEFIARMDADDISLPLRFEKQVNYLRQYPNVIVLGTNIKYIGKSNWLHESPTIVYTDKEIKAQLLLKNAFVHSSVFIRKEILDNNHISYDENYRQTQDLRLWETLMPYGDFANLTDKLILYRLSDQQITKQSGQKQVGNSWQVRYRLQKKWLQKIGYNYSEETIAISSFEILSQIRKRKDVRESLEFKSFIQFVYMTSTNKKEVIKYFLEADWKYFTFADTCRMLRKLFNVN